MMKIRGIKILAGFLGLLALGAFGEVIFMYQLMSFVDWLYVFFGGICLLGAWRLWKRA